MALQGKGFFIWKIPDCEGGNPTAIANAAVAAKFTHVLIKIADGNYSYNYNRTTKVDLVPPVAQALRAKGIQVWGWHYVYGYDPAGEARIAVQRIKDLNLQGYVIDAEGEYKQSGRETAARKFMTDLRASLPNLPIALSSYRFPSYHPQLPWKAFLEKCDYNMPQVYWEQAHNPADQLARSVRELTAITPSRPVIPTGPAYGTGGWAPTTGDITNFMNKARELNLSAVNFFSWDECRAGHQALWETIASYSWGTGPVPKDIVEQYIDALNTRDPSIMASLYTQSAVLITAARTIQGTGAIIEWYTTLFSQLLPRGIFKLTGYSGSGSTRHFTWTATSDKGRVTNGSDTFGLLNGKVAYHYSFFTIISP